MSIREKEKQAGGREKETELLSHSKQTRSWISRVVCHLSINILLLAPVNPLLRESMNRGNEKIASLPRCYY